MSNIVLPLEEEAIKDIVPHREPFLFLDRIVEFEASKRIVGEKEILAEDPIFKGHFPGRPILPGVIMLEALAQLGVALAKLSAEDDEGKLFVFAGIDNARFKRQVVPGEVLTLEGSLLRKRKSFWKIDGVAHVNGEVATTAELTAIAVE